jgi:hypothetical protein
MIILSLMCAVLATWAVSPPAPSVRLSSRLSNGPNAKPETRRLRWWLMALPLTGGIGIATAGCWLVALERRWHLRWPLASPRRSGWQCRKLGGVPRSPLEGR